MTTYCNATGLPYSDKMLTWKSREFPDWMDFPHYDAWHGKVMKSTGFVIEAESPQPQLCDLLPQFQEAAVKALPYYEVMKKSAQTCTE